MENLNSFVLLKAFKSDGTFVLGTLSGMVFAQLTIAAGAFDWGTFVGIIAIPLSLLLWHFPSLRKTGYPCRMVFFVEESIDLFSDVVQAIPELRVLFKDTPVTSKMVLVSGYLVNTGMKDIFPAHVETPLRVVLPEPSRFLSIQPGRASETLKFTISEESPTICSITTGLFRREEFLRLRFLIENLPNATEQKPFRFEHRIAEMDRVSVTNLPKPIPRIPWFVEIVPFIVVAVMLFVSWMLWQTESNLVSSRIFALLMATFFVKMLILPVQGILERRRNAQLRRALGFQPFAPKRNRKTEQVKR